MATTNILLLSISVYFTISFVTQISTCTALKEKQTSNKTFSIDYANNTFLKDGQPFRYVSGSFHYSRVHPFYWKDRLQKTRAAGVNTIQVYVPWNVHEITPGEYTWTGGADLSKFLSLAQEADLVVLLRLGPYICGEWEFGGFPAWLLTANSSMILRSSDPSYMKYVDRWFTQLLAKVKPLLYNNGGPVIMVQIENEYGSFFTCDMTYKKYLRDKVLADLGDLTVIYTTDGDGPSYLKCGIVKGAYATVDFGVTFSPAYNFQAQRAVEPKGPLVNSEFYTGWLDHWGQPHQTVDAVKLAKSLDLLLNYSANVNMYMFVGGTNFGFTNGANSPPYLPQPTSYDYDSPVSEAGDVTLKFYAIRDIISKYLPLPSVPVPPNTKKGKYGPVPMEFVMTIQDALQYLCPEGPTKNTYPVNMEKLKFYDGFILYRFTLKKTFETPTPLYTRGVRDRAVVMVNAVPFGLLERDQTTSVSITGTPGQLVDILVENTGRINFGSAILFNTKGIIENVLLDGDIITDWEIYPLHLENIGQLLEHAKRSSETRTLPQQSADGKLMTPAIYSGDIAITDAPLDTFLDPSNWGKGQAFINGFNLGRYWPGRGPQVTLYTPAPELVQSPKVNKLALLEVESSPCGTVAGKGSGDCQVVLTDVPNLNGPNGPGSFQSKATDFSQDWMDPSKHLVH